MVREFLLGKRVTYYAPVPLLICLVAIYALASYVITDAVVPTRQFRNLLPSKYFTFFGRKDTYYF